MFNLKILMCFMILQLPYTVNAAPFCADIEGNLVLPATSTTKIEIGGTATNCTNVDSTNTDFDRISVAGDLTLAGGALEVELINGYSPVAGDRFDIFDWGTQSGTFAVVDTSAAQLTTGLSWDVSSLYVSGELVVASDSTSVPYPIWALLLFTAMLLYTAKYRRV